MRKTLVSCVAVLMVLGAWVALRAADNEPANAKIGQPAPNFKLTDQNGKDVSLSDYSGKIVVLEWTNPNCPFVQRHYKEKTMANLSAKYGPDGVVWIAINSTKHTTDADNLKWVEAQNIAYPVLCDASGVTGHAYHATNTPDMYIIAKDGTLLYKGAIDNDPQGKKTEGKVNYVQQAMDEILAGKSVSQPETKPYGCSVYYVK